MGIEVDIYSGATKVGSGPITTATDWTQTALLDRVGSFSFACSAADPQASYLALRRHVYAYENGQLVGAGVIDRIQKVTGSGGVPMVQVSGNDLGIELTWCRTGDLSLSTQDWQTAVSVSQVEVNSDGAGQNPYAHPECVDGSTATWGRLDLYEDHQAEGWHKYFYVGGASTWDRAYFNCALDTTGPSTGYGGGLIADGTLQYYDSNGWCTATVVSDGTAASTDSFDQAGTIVWSPSTSGAMKQTTENGTAGYYLRGHLPDHADGLLWYEVKTWGPAPTDKALNLIEGVLPTTGNGYAGTWTIATTAGSTDTTSTSVYDNLHEENCFEALTKVAEMTAEHFYLTPGRKVVWLGKVSST